jgi:predicted dehydrogenase
MFSTGNKTEDKDHRVLKRWNAMNIKIGLMGTGLMATLFTRAVDLADKAVVDAVLIRPNSESQDFATKNRIRKTYYSQEAFLNDPDVDVVYIASPHSIHKSQIIAALNAGKHVFCEKPLCVNAVEAREVINLARQKGLFLMEAMWIRFLPSVIQALDWIRQGEIGEVYLVESRSGSGALLRENVNQRLLLPELAGGALLELGVYPVSLGSFIFGEKPSGISASASFSDTGIDKQTSMILTYGNGAMLNGNCSLEVNISNGSHIYGTKGSIEIPSYWWARRPMKLLRENKLPLLVDDSHENWFEGYSYQVKEMVHCLKNGLTESPTISLNETVSIIETLDDIRNNIGLTYPMDQSIPGSYTKEPAQVA